jgi:hypothetical protein
MKGQQARTVRGGSEHATLREDPMTLGDATLDTITASAVPACGL